MAQYQTVRTAPGVRTAEIDAGLRAHMNKVYGTMSVGSNNHAYGHRAVDFV